MTTDPHAYEAHLSTDAAEREAAYRLRYALYVERQKLFVDEADHERRTLSDAIDEHAALFVVTHQGEVVGTARLHWGGEGRFDAETRELFDIERFTDLIEESDIALGSRLLVHPDHRRGPVATLLQMTMLEHVVEQGTELVVADCEPHLVNVWSRLGHRPYGLAEHPQNGTLVRLALPIGDDRHPRAIGSPLAPVFERWTRPRMTARRLSARLARSNQVVSEAQDSQAFWASVEETLSLDRLAALLGQLDVDELDALLGNSHALSCAPESVLIRKGHSSRTLYVLLTGSLEVWDEGRRVAVVREPGAVVGEVALFSGNERMSDVLTGSEGARVLALSERNLDALIRAQGAGAAKFLLMLTRSLSTKLHERRASPEQQ
ncbi:hypothetical protein PPSIR1_03143 [Plesiocystis pacifica SIR-1]|uniref:Cyclic nucleotide-binding domain-containing protein n=1 Tax=Plesiocystis pacifica SIR-1 TaxID=391625 RepID=A6GI23_9BACT|nr:GNAT family N-acetyltransferase [Plesiocystis pacifica]EDM74486.1 hypothetical protein PPSIR1_03143 [Plesiocystis pacifica SIR-1]